MIHDEECPLCHHKFEVFWWENGTCEKCGNEYMWDSYLEEDYSNEYPFVLWKKYIEEKT